MKIQTKEWKSQTEWETHDLTEFVTKDLLNTDYRDGQGERSLRLLENQAGYIALIVNALAEQGLIKMGEIIKAKSGYYEDARLIKE